MPSPSDNPVPSGTGPAPIVTVKIVGAASRGRQIVDARRGDLVYRNTVDLNIAKARKNFATAVKNEFHLDGDQVQKIEQDLQLQVADWDSAGDQAANDTPTDSPAEADMDPAVRAAAEAFLRSPDIAGELRRDFATIGIVGEWVLTLTLFLAAVSRLLPKPLSVCVRAASSSGKSCVSDRVVGLMPNSMVQKATSISSNALYHLPPGSMRNRILFLAERAHPTRDKGESANATLPIREMLSSGSLRKAVTVAKPDGGFETRELVQEGPITLIVTTTERQIFEEDINRMLVVTTDESPAQTAAILQAKAAAAAGAGAPQASIDAVRKQHQAAQLLLRPLAVNVPFAYHICRRRIGSPPDAKLIFSSASSARPPCCARSKKHPTRTAI